VASVDTSRAAEDGVSFGLYSKALLDNSSDEAFQETFAEPFESLVDLPQGVRIDPGDKWHMSLKKHPCQYAASTLAEFTDDDAIKYFNRRINLYSKKYAMRLPRSLLPQKTLLPSALLIDSLLS
jgi:hypothetical protein